MIKDNKYVYADKNAVAFVEKDGENGCIYINPERVSSTGWEITYIAVMLSILQKGVEKTLLRFFAYFLMQDDIAQEHYDTIIITRGDLSYETCIG